MYYSSDVSACKLNGISKDGSCGFHRIGIDLLHRFSWQSGFVLGIKPNSYLDRILLFLLRSRFGKDRISFNDRLMSNST